MTILNTFVIRVTNTGAFYTDWAGLPHAYVTREAAQERADILAAENPANTYDIVPFVLAGTPDFDGPADGTIVDIYEHVARERDSEKSRREEFDRQAERARRNHEADIATIGERLMDEAEHRGWCSEYDSIVDDLNRSLHVELPTRNKTWDVCWTVNVTVHQTIEARTANDAAEMANLDRYMIREAVDCGSWDYDSPDIEESDD